MMSPLSRPGRLLRSRGPDQPAGAGYR